MIFFFFWVCSAINSLAFYSWLGDVPKVKWLAWDFSQLQKPFFTANLQRRKRAGRRTPNQTVWTERQNEGGWDVPTALERGRIRGVPGESTRDNGILTIMIEQASPRSAGLRTPTVHPGLRLSPLLSLSDLSQSEQQGIRSTLLWTWDIVSKLKEDKNILHFMSRTEKHI